MKQEDLEATLRESLTAAGIPPEAISKALREVRKAIDEEKAAKPPASKAKSQYIVYLDDPENRFEGQAFLGWVVTVDSELPPQSALDLVKASAHAFNGSKKGRSAPVKDLREAFVGVPAKFWNNGVEGQKVARKTKEPVLIQPVNGSLT